MQDLQALNREFEEKSVQEKAQSMAMGYVDIGSLPINPDHLKVVSRADAVAAGVVPFFKIGKKLRLALAHPTQPETLALIRKLKEEGYSINVNLASDRGIQESLSLYERLEPARPVPTQNQIDEEHMASYQEEVQNLTGLKSKIESITSDEALNVLQVGAVKTGASDMHFQPEENKALIRFRIDGVLQTVLSLDIDVYQYLANQLKYKAGMKLNVNNVPQDGRYFFTINDRKVDVRVSAIPTEFGESFVCRLLDSKKKQLAFEDLGLQGRNLELLKKALTLPNGMVLVTGPTGSGKTTTLYALLNAFNQPENKIITLEDPIEYHLKGITQSQINEKRGYTFSGGLRAILRQDPDIVMIGEIRDADTADTAAQAALTGHILLSTLHTNSAVETIPRLRNIGLKPFMIAPALGIVLAQRLVRRLCPYCAEQKPVTPSEKAVLEPIATRTQVPMPVTLPHGAGCDHCNKTGYLGQVAMMEGFEMTDSVRALVLQEASTEDLLKQLKAEGMLTMAEDGALKVLSGLTTLSEVERLTRLQDSGE